MAEYLEWHDDEEPRRATTFRERARTAVRQEMGLDPIANTKFDGGPELGGAWNALVVPPSLVYGIERTFAAWLNIVIASYTFATLLMHTNPATAAAKTIPGRMQDPLFIIGFVLSVVMLGAGVYMCFVFERRLKMFRGNNRFFNRVGIYVCLVPLFIVMCCDIFSKIPYGATKTVAAG